MVGVPGRSKACHTCRQRRIRCNGEKPHCSNCTKSMRSCGGYLRNHVFVLSENMAVEPCLSHGSSGNSEPGSLMVARWRVDPAKPSQPAAVLKIASLRLQHQYGASLPHPISPRHAGQQQILDVFLRHHLPSEALNHAGPITSQRHWLLEIQDAPSMGPALEYSVLALCMAKLGRKFDDENLVREGLSMYTKGLRALRMAVRNPKTRSDDETLAACLALGACESAQRPDWGIDGFIAHYQGAVSLLLLRPPEAYMSGLAHCIFEELRIQSVFLGMHLRRKTPLADSRWRDVPWKTAQKGSRDHLIDILLDIPEVYRRVDGLSQESSRPKILSSLVDTIDLCWRVDSQLSHWYDSFKALVAGPIYWPTLSTNDSPVDDIESGKVFPVAYHFQSYDVAHAMILYWVGILLLHPIMCLLYEKLGGLAAMVSGDDECPCEKIEMPNTGTPKLTSTICLRHFTKTLAPLGYRTEWDRGAACNVCQSAEFVMQENMGDLGQYIFLARIMVVREFLAYAPGDWSRELRWIAELVSKIQNVGNDVS